MATDAWLALSGALLLAASAAARMLARRWQRAAAWLRGAAGAALLASLILATLADGGSPRASDQAATGLALATVLAALLLHGRRGRDVTGPAADLAALVLSLVGAFATQAAPCPTPCLQDTLFCQIARYLFLAGGGAILAAASVAAMAGRGALPGNWGQALLPARRIDVYAALQDATALALLLWGSGLVVSAWGAWQTLGQLASGDPGQVWIAVAWLWAGASWLAWRLGTRPARWAAGFSLVAALVAVAGLLLT